MEPKQKMMKNELSMTSGAPFRAILTFATPLVLGYILQQLYLIIDAVIVGRWIGLVHWLLWELRAVSCSLSWASATVRVLALLFL